MGDFAYLSPRESVSFLQISWQRNVNGTFINNAISLSVPSPSFVTVADMDNDGRLDVIATSFTNASVWSVYACVHVCMCAIVSMCCVCAGLCVSVQVACACKTLCGFVCAYVCSHTCWCMRSLVSFNNCTEPCVRLLMPSLVLFSCAVTGVLVQKRGG